MKALSFITSLVPSLERGRVTKELADTLAELNETVIPPYRVAVEQWGPGNAKFKSTQITKLNAEWMSQVRGSKGNMLRSINETLLGLRDAIPDLQKEVDRTFDDKIIAGGVTYRKANLLQFISSVGFFVRYSRRLLNLVLVEESAAVGNKTEIISPLSKGEIKRLYDGWPAFLQVAEMYQRKYSDIVEAIQATPDALIVPEEEGLLKETLGPTKLDPLNMDFISVQFNPIFHIRLMVANYRNDRYEEALTERQALEFRLLALKDLQDNGQVDAKLQRNIEVTSDRLTVLKRRIAEYEDEVNG